MTQKPHPGWQILDISSVPVTEFASALHSLVPTIGWWRKIRTFAPLTPSVRFATQTDPPLEVAQFTMQRGFSNPFLNRIFPFTRRLAAKMLANAGNPRLSPLVCTSPFYASVAELWPGPVIYYSTDLTIAYDSLDPRQVLSLDRRLCAVATLVCPNSSRIGEYLVDRAGCDPKKLTVLPNATRRTNTLDRFASGPSPLPIDIENIPRPIAGVIGNLSSNLDWILLESVVERTPWLSWVFVGPTSMPIADRRQRQARKRVMRTRSAVRFIGPRPYTLLQEYARSIDVAVLPYCNREPTFSGSPTRFYEHLAACRPMIATRSVEQLLHKEPLVRLVSGADEMLDALEQLKAAGFHDGFERIRWSVSQQETWLHRAAAMIEGLETIAALQTCSPAPGRSRLAASAGIES